MAHVIIPIGPQCAGKSTLFEKVAAAAPGVTIISRDKILIEMFGTVLLDSYSGGHFAGMERFWEEVTTYMQQPTRLLLLDVWNSHPFNRRDIVKKLRDLGATHVEGWHFITPLKKVIEWSFVRTPHVDKNKWSEMSRRHKIERYTEIYKSFRAMDIEMEEVFDSVRKVSALDPVQMDFFADTFEAATHG